MKAYYRDVYGNYAVMEVEKASYDSEREALELCGTEEDLLFLMKKSEADAVILALYDDGKIDVSKYTCMEDDFDDDDDDFYDDDEDDEDEDDIIDRMLDMDFSDHDGKDRIVFRKD